MTKLPVHATDDDGTWTYYIKFGDPKGEPDSSVILEDALFLAAEDETLARVEFAGLSPEHTSALKELSRTYPDIEILPETVSIKISEKKPVDELSCQVIIDLDQDGKIFGIEII